MSWVRILVTVTTFYQYSSPLYCTSSLLAILDMFHALASVAHVDRRMQEGFHEEAKCGRPLGLAFDKKNQMYVADAYYGIFQVDLATGKSKNLVSVNDTIEGKKPMIPNSVAVDNTGAIFWTDSSTSHYLHDGVFLALLNGNGRLLKYDPSSKTNKVLLDKLHFSNGVALSEDGAFLLISETFNFRVLKYHLKGPKAGQSEVFVDRLPGCPDNIHRDGRGGFVLSLVLPRDMDHPSMVERLAPYPLVRKLLARLMYLGQRAVSLLRDLYPHEVLKKTAHLIGHFESLPSPSVKRTTVLLLTKEGKISRSLHATDGLLGVSDFVEHDGHYYLGSPFNTYVARVKAT
ncbi:adipocyte plasma membrane-associated protein Hemomucin-like isoform X2 [Macrosteles quadrilineatus]|uniref:adipocyte plasma membrane-associated protein Hemomucin-like isoform X2 n=1 Tax=Macrosteles quadrilineatus TaxID=74068 RepID=UPI0023E0E047|nr:adipocyte plasma membrane-associated protein Hemomucin-like isoform X2 [Macrosteles quadrilineatus]